MASKWPLANGNWSNAANWNGGTKPVAGDDVFADGRTLNVDESFDVATLRTTQRSGGTLGGTFNFNTAGVTGTVTNSTQGFFQGTLANAITIAAASGTVTLSFNSNFGNNNAITLMQYTGLCNLTMTAPAFNGLQTNPTAGGVVLINKTSSGTITLNGNVVSGNSNGGNQNNTLVSTAGATIVNGNVSGFSSGISGPNYGISQSGGTLVVNGNVVGGGANNATTAGILFSGTSMTINGNVTGGTTGLGISTSSPLNTITGTVTGSGAVAFSTSGATNNITGNVTAGTTAAIASSSAIQLQVTGTVTASATAVGISMTNANGQVYLNGNMVNNNGKMAIYAPIVWLDTTGTTTASFFTSGGSPRTLYSEDTFPNMPAEADTRDNIVYGPGGGLRGTLRMPAAADTRNGVVYDNGTTGTALFTTSLFLTELSSSTVPVAIRMQNLCTPMILGELMEAYKK
jgi:hypothetical protein